MFLVVKSTTGDTQHAFTVQESTTAQELRDVIAYRFGIAPGAKPEMCEPFGDQQWSYISVEGVLTRAKRVMRGEEDALPKQTHHTIYIDLGDACPRATPSSTASSTAKGSRGRAQPWQATARRLTIQYGPRSDSGLLLSADEATGEARLALRDAWKGIELLVMQQHPNSMFTATAKLTAAEVYRRAVRRYIQQYSSGMRKLMTQARTGTTSYMDKNHPDELKRANMYNARSVLYDDPAEEETAADMRAAHDDYQAGRRPAWLVEALKLEGKQQQLLSDPRVLATSASARSENDVHGNDQETAMQEEAMPPHMPVGHSLAGALAVAARTQDGAGSDGVDDSGDEAAAARGQGARKRKAPAG